MTTEQTPAEPDKGKTETTPAPETDASKQAATDAAEIEKWKGLSRQHEGRAKSNAEAAVKLAEIEESQKSEVDKANDKITKADARADLAETELIRLRVAVRHGMTEDQAARLVGTTEAELDADAVEFKKLLAPEEEEEEGGEEGEGTPTPGGTPKPRLKSGSSSGALNDEDRLLRDLKRKVGVK